jgi:hypothetical protein
LLALELAADSEREEISRSLQVPVVLFDDALSISSIESKYPHPELIFFEVLCDFARDSPVGDAMLKGLPDLGGHRISLFGSRRSLVLGE